VTYIEQLLERRAYCNLQQTFARKTAIDFLFEGRANAEEKQRALKFFVRKNVNLNTTNAATRTR
jgi:hypothetical protein